MIHYFLIEETYSLLGTMFLSDLKHFLGNTVTLNKKKSLFVNPFYNRQTCMKLMPTVDYYIIHNFVQSCITVANTMSLSLLTALT